MSVIDRMRGLFGRAKAEAAELAQTARIKLDLRNLEGRHDQLLREIGRKAYNNRDQPFRIVTEIEPMFGQVANIEAKRLALQSELKRKREREPSATG